MSSVSSSPTLQICRTCGGGAPIDVHFCPQCTKILSLGRHGDYFAFLGVPRKLNVDPRDLEQRFRSLSRQFHPDYFYNASAAERLASLERSSYLNDAYRTLKQPIPRIAYLLELEGVLTAADHSQGNASKQVPPALLEEVFALNEELDEVRGLRESGAPAEQWRQRLHGAAKPIEAKRVEHEEQLRTLAARWDALEKDANPEERKAVLSALRERMLERNYINNLLGTIERELDGSGLRTPDSESGPKAEA
jgi:molecular chaperone HscB